MSGIVPNFYFAPVPFDCSSMDQLYIENLIAANENAKVEISASNLPLHIKIENNLIAEDNLHRLRMAKFANKNLVAMQQVSIWDRLFRFLFIW